MGNRKEKIQQRILAITEWKTQHADLIALLTQKGFILDPNSDPTNDLLFFEKKITFEMDLGSDITDETLKAPDPIQIPNELINKYGIQLTEHNPFTEKVIIRKKTIQFIPTIRLKILSPDPCYTMCHIGLFANHNTVGSPNLEHEWKLKTFDDMEEITTIMTEIETKIADAIHTILSSLPEKIQYARKEIQNWKEHQARAVKSAKAKQTMINALQQFDSFQ